MAATKKNKKRISKKKLSLEEKRIKREQNKLHKSIMKVYKDMGFEYIRTNDKHKIFGGQKSDIDNVFIYENLILLCEETISQDNKAHIRKKKDYYEKILDNKDELLSWLKSIDKSKFEKFDNYPPSRYKIHYIYISSNEIDDEIKEEFPSLKFIGEKNHKYFQSISSCIKHTARNELYKFLNLQLTDIGTPSSSIRSNDIETAVIIPESGSGFPNGVLLVTFVVTPEELIDCACVFRKDSWENSTEHYQRLIDKKKINKIRKFLHDKKRTFIDNILVSLPEDVEFSTKSKTSRRIVNIIEEVDQIENLSITIPYKVNTIGIIDGQHRLFGHYRDNDTLEPSISKLRNRRHLLVTGIYYDKNKFTPKDKRKFESELFLQINSEQKNVDKSILQYIQTIKDPYSAIGIANNVLLALNRREPFLNLFNTSSLDNKGIRTPTIIQYGLKELVDISDAKVSLYKYYQHDNKNALLEPKKYNDDVVESVYNDYVKYCAGEISIFFSAVKASFNKELWTIDRKSKLLSVTSIVAFMMSFRKANEKYKSTRNFNFYKNKIVTLKVDFNKEKFPYISSHWTALAEEIDKCWES